VLNPHRNAYRDRPQPHDFYDLDTSQPFAITVVLDALSDEDCDVFEEFLEGQQADGTFTPSESPEEEFDQGTLVLRLLFRGDLGEVSRAVFARPDADGVVVRQDHKIRIGWQLIRAGLDPLRELAFYGNSVFAKLFERVDLSAELDQIRQGIEAGKSGLMAEPHVADTKAKLEEAATRLGVTEGTDPLDFQVLDLSDREVLQSLQLVLRGMRSAHRLPLRSHGAGAARALLLAALLQQARLDNTNLILAVEEPEQNLEPVNQRLVTRSLLMDPEADTAQVVLSTHSPTVAGVVPVDQLHLVRDFADGPNVRALSDVPVAQRKLLERHAQSALVGGLYADLILLVEGPSETGALPGLWQQAFASEGLDERRFELIACEGDTRIQDYAALFHQIGIPVAALCDCEEGKETQRAEILQAGAGLLVHWQSHSDWEGVLAGEADVGATTRAMERVRSEFASWAEDEGRYVEIVRQAGHDGDHLAAATDIGTLVNGFSDENEQRAVVAVLLRTKSLGFKGAFPHRVIAEELPDVPPSIKEMMRRVHAFAESGPSEGGERAL
jgi:hypothetical protein